VEEGGERAGRSSQGTGNILSGKAEAEGIVLYSSVSSKLASGKMEAEKGAQKGRRERVGGISNFSVQSKQPKLPFSALKRNEPRL
jgi:hypothetical protein